MKNATLIAGPTASGKSAMALELARQGGGTIVNADSMQVYDGLRMLTARPADAELSMAPHRLYGHVDPAEAYSTGRFMRDVEALVRSGAFSGGPVIFVGGTGLYFRALLEGLSEMPAVPDGIRAKWRAALEAEGAAALHALLAESDPQAALGINPADGQRIVRALEVLDASGSPISYWQKTAGKPLVHAETATLLVLEPDRKLLARRIDERFDAMMDAGALDEVRALAARRLDPALPVMKAIGVRELMAADDGETGMAEAVERSKIATRQYAKRQATWFRNQLDERWRRIAING